MPKYSVDTSAILDAWVRYYPFDIFPSFWSKFQTLINSKDGIAIELIHKELGKKDDGCLKWFEENSLNHFFIEITKPIQTTVTELLTHQNYQRLVEDRKGVFGADPFVIALAKVENLIVVTGERPSNNILKPKIPDVCIDLSIEYINIQDLMRREGWHF